MVPVQENCCWISVAVSILADLSTRLYFLLKSVLETLFFFFSSSSPSSLIRKLLPLPSLHQSPSGAREAVQQVHGSPIRSVPLDLHPCDHSPPLAPPQPQQLRTLAGAHAKLGQKHRSSSLIKSNVQVGPAGLVSAAH